MKNRKEISKFKWNNIYLLVDAFIVLALLIEFIKLVFIYKLTRFEYFVSQCLFLITLYTLKNDKY